MTTEGKSISQEVKELLATYGDNGRLRVLVDEQTRIGIAKYGQTLDDNVKEPRQKAAHMVQELIDGMQYGVWLSRDNPEITAYLMNSVHALASTANVIAAHFNLSVDELTFKEQHSSESGAE